MCQIRLALALWAFVVCSPVEAQSSKQTAEHFFPHEPGEAQAKQPSLNQSRQYLDNVATFWVQKNSCGACHANYAYLMARPTLGDSPLLAQTRQFLEKRDKFDFDLGKTTHLKKGDPISDGETVAIAFALAWDDARTTGKLAPTTAKALKRMWSRQHSPGQWGVLDCGHIFPAAETDDEYLMTLAALAAGIAPEGYAHTEEARYHVDGLRRALAKPRYGQPHSPHRQAMQLWAAQHLDGVMTPTQKEQAIKSLLARQRPDGGWSAYDLLPFNGRYRPNLREVSDGYGTGFIVFVLRQAGVPADRPEIQRGIDWLKKNQRISGRWYTHPLDPGGDTDGRVGTRDLYFPHLGTAFAILALDACKDEGSAVKDGLSVTVRPAKLAFAAEQVPTFEFVFSNRSGKPFGLRPGQSIRSWVCYGGQEADGPWETEYHGSEEDPGVVLLEPGKSFTKTYQMMGPFVYQGKSQLGLSRNGLPPARYEMEVYLTVKDNDVAKNPVPNWTGSLVIKPVKFEIGAQK